MAGVHFSESIRRVEAILRKEFAVDIRSRHGLSSLAMFVLVVSLIVAFSLGPEAPTARTTAALLLTAIFFTSVAGLSRSFVAERERGTLLLLQLTSSASPVFFGKLLYNLLLSTLGNIGLALCFLLFIPRGWGGSEVELVGIVVLLGLGTGSAMTIVSALLAHAASRSTLGAVLALPLMMPIVYLGVEMLSIGAGGGTGLLAGNLGLIALGYPIVVLLLGTLLLDFIWEE